MQLFILLRYTFPDFNYKQRSIQGEIRYAKY